MKVAELRKALEGVPDDHDVIVRTFEFDDGTIVETPTRLAVEPTCGDDADPFFAIDVYPADLDALAADIADADLDEAEPPPGTLEG